MLQKSGALVKHGWDADAWHMVTNREGVPVGKWKVPFQPCAVEVEIVRSFLMKVSQQKQEEGKSMSQSEEATNIVYVAGKLKLDPKIENEGTRCLIELPGMKNAIPVGVKKTDDGLADKLARYRAGDFIQIIAMLDPYGVKQADGSWKNGMGIKITAIRNDPPHRQQSQQRQQAPQRYGNDDIPF